MYSPKIREDLIPLLYHEAKKREMKMTALVNTILAVALQKINDKNQPLPLPEE